MQLNLPLKNLKNKTEKKREGKGREKEKKGRKKKPTLWPYDTNKGKEKKKKQGGSSWRGEGLFAHKVQKALSNKIGLETYQPLTSMNKKKAENQKED